MPSGKRITELDEETELTNSHYFVVSDGSDTKRVSRKNVINNIASNENRVLVVLGDSWSDGKNDPDRPWPLIVTEKLGLTAYVTAAVAGRGFSYGGSTSIPNQVASAVTKVQQAGYTADDVRYVVAFGGVNDFRHSQTYINVSAGMRTTYDNARAAFPNAEVFIIGPNAGKWDVMDSLDSTSSDKIDSYATFPAFIHNIKNNMHNNGYPIVWDAGAWLNYYGKDTGNLYNSDLLHPNQTGHCVVAAYVCEVLRGIYSGPHHYSNAADQAPASGDADALLNYSIACDNGIATIQFDMLGDPIEGTSTIYWTLNNFPLMPAGSGRRAYRAGFVCSNFNTPASLADTAYEPIRGYFNPVNRRLTIYPNKTGVLYQLFGTVSLHIY